MCSWLISQKVGNLPRTRGGDPETPYILAIGLQFSPHTRG
nr:MAG TPA: hypothetical protein [Caudoviricetes sp.]